MDFRKTKIIDALQIKEVTASKKRKIDKQANKSSKKKKKESSSDEEKQKVVKHNSKKSKNTDVKKKSKETTSVVTQPAEDEISSGSSSDSEPAKTITSHGDDVAPSSGLPKHKKIAEAVEKSPNNSSTEDSSSEDDNPVEGASSTVKKSQEGEGDSSPTSSSLDTPAAKQPFALGWFVLSCYNNGINFLCLGVTAIPHPLPKADKKSKAKLSSNQPFSRVNKQTTVDPKLADNSFEAKVIIL